MRETFIRHPFYGDVFCFGEEDFISRQILKGKEWESEVADLMEKYVEKDTDVLDIGANLGFSTLGLLRRLWKSGKTIGQIHCFEPQPDVAKLLIANTKKEKAVRVYSFALSNCYAVASIARETKNIGGAHVKDEEGALTVAMLPLNHFAHGDHFKRRVSLVKIDVEEHEDRLIRGAEYFLHLHRPYIFIEITDERYPMVRDILAENDYAMEIHIGGWDYIFRPEGS